MLNHLQRLQVDSSVSVWPIFPCCLLEEGKSSVHITMLAGGDHAEDCSLGPKLHGSEATGQYSLGLKALWTILRQEFQNSLVHAALWRQFCILSGSPVMSSAGPDKLVLPDRTPVGTVRSVC
jgi:hypothetical protein